MEEDIKALVSELQAHGFDRLSSREKRVLAHIASRRHVSRDPGSDYRAGLTLGQRAADSIARWGGSWAFLGGFAMFLLLWSGWNLLSGRPFDPYPFIFLNLLLSMLAAAQAPIIMMSQNRQAEIDRRRATNDYEVNLKAELEIMELHAKIDRLTDRLSP